MQFISRFLALLIMFPTQALGFALALDQSSANDTYFVAARVDETTTLTAFAGEANTTWLILTPPNAAIKAVPRTYLHALEVRTRPILHQMIESDPCEAAKSIESGHLKPGQKYAPMLVAADPLPDLLTLGKRIVSSSPWDGNQHPLDISADLQSFIDEGWELQVIELEEAGEGLQFSINAERFEIPPRPVSGTLDRGEFTLITIADARMEPGNFKSQLPPTNIEIQGDASDHESVDRLLAGVFAEVDKNENGAFITEFATDLPRWDFKPPIAPFSSKQVPEEITITRLRRFGDLGQFSSPMHLFPAFKMAGGDDVEVNGRLRSGGYSADRNDFRTRLTLRRSVNRASPVHCENPVWDTWVSLSADKIRGRFDPTATDDSRKRLFRKWLANDVPEIYWSFTPETDSVANPQVDEAPGELEKKRSQCQGCSTPEPFGSLVLLFGVSLVLRKKR